MIVMLELVVILKLILSNTIPYLKKKPFMIMLHDISEVV